MNILCSEHYRGPCSRKATEFLLIKRPGMAGWEGRPRCDRHPAADYIAIVRRLVGAQCLIVPIPGMVTA